MSNYQKINNITGWVIFLISTVVYFITVEDTASYWDCGEFIAVSYKLEVPHPPGAPLFLLIGRIFSFLAGDDVTRVAYWINISSVLSSGFTILFLFWTITLFGRKMFKIKAGEETISQTIILIGSAAVGALAYTFTDSFWFSAVEAEVYAMSSFFTAFVVWAILKWELIEDESMRNRWLILIAYMIGLSIGVHLLNLVTLPALALIYYFRNHKPSGPGIVATLGISVIIIGIIMSGIITGLPSIAGTFEIFFVNGVGLPFGSGIIIFMLLIIGALVYGIYYSIKKNKVIMNTALLSLTFILIGYSSYTLVVIRSGFNPPIDENNPENIISFVSYLKREQYGERPLLKGPYFTSKLEEQSHGAPVYEKGEKKYEIIDHKLVNKYDKEVLFPRAWSNDGRHAAEYRKILSLGQGQEPSFAENLYYMFARQIGTMYVRYFMWNFAGRESDIQYADWLRPWDSKDDVPEILAMNKARNNFYMLPFLLGLVGMIFHYLRDKKNFAVVGLLFILTGVALVLYLNSPPIEPRERDYIYAGSFYAFAIWIGFGVMALWTLLKNYIKDPKIAPGAAIAVCAVVPIIMAAQGWDDHDRSNRYFSVDSAANLLNSLEENAVLFTGGDNDTFPLWYAQEVEGIRTDVRVVVLSYFNTDWYVDQMTRPAYESTPLPFSLERTQYRQGSLNDYIPVVPNPNIKGDAIDLKEYMKLVKANHQAIQIPTSLSTFNSVPANNLVLRINRDEVINKGIIPQSKLPYLVDRMNLKIKNGRLLKGDLMLLDLIVNGNWDRPLYFNTTSLSGFGVDVNDYVIQEGMAYRLLPIQKPDRSSPFVNTDLMYDNMMTKFKFRELDNPDVYYTEDYKGMVQNHRMSFNALATALLQEGKKDKAAEVIYKSLDTMPDAAIEFDYSNVESVDLLIRVGDNERAKAVAEVMGRRAIDYLAYHKRKDLGPDRLFQMNLFGLQQLSTLLGSISETEMAVRYSEAFTEHYERFK